MNKSKLLILVIILFSTKAALAETVFVKYKGPTDISKFNCELTKSSFIHRICYSEKEKYAVVLLGGTYYHYCRINDSVIKDWKLASSIGRFYNQRIKYTYDCRLGGVPKDI